MSGRQPAEEQLNNFKKTAKVSVQVEFLRLIEFSFFRHKILISLNKYPKITFCN